MIENANKKIPYRQMLVNYPSMPLLKPVCIMAQKEAVGVSKSTSYMQERKIISKTGAARKKNHTSLNSIVLLLSTFRQIDLDDYQ